jgi:serine/threonine protein kinase
MLTYADVCIVLQVFAGLKYLNEQKNKVIHFDLKPGNILFHQVKKIQVYLLY